MTAGNSPRQPDAPLHSTVRLKLVMPAHDSPPPPSNTAQPHISPAHESSGSPERPSYSPVTPTLSQASLTAQDDAQPPQWMEDPEPLPVSLDDNSDAIALRAALSILQIQRQQALRDMRDLDRMKDAALNDPEQFVRDLEQGRLTRSSHTKDEAVGDHVEDAPPAADDPSKFGKFPGAQDIVRAPPVEWAKYHIAGEPLDRLHAVQQHYPGFIESGQITTSAPQPHEIAAPYRPFQDRLSHSESAARPQAPKQSKDT